MVRYSTAKHGGRNRLLFANPDNLEKDGGPGETGKPRDRKNVTVKLSYDEGKKWPVSRTVEAGYSGYSDLAVLANGTILLLYEKAPDGARAFQPDSLTLAKFSLAWLTNGVDASKKAGR
jgi:sialidase-1